MSTAYFVLLILVVFAALADCASKQCDPKVAIKKPKLFSNGSILDEEDASNRLYPLGAYLWSADGYFGCVCSVMTCVRKCCMSHELTRGEKLRCSRIREGVRGSFQIPESLARARVVYETPCDDMGILVDEKLVFYAANGSLNSAQIGRVNASRICFEYVEQHNRTYSFVCSSPGPLQNIGNVLFLLFVICTAMFVLNQCWRKCLWCLYWRASI